MAVVEQKLPTLPAPEFTPCLCAVRVAQCCDLLMIVRSFFWTLYCLSYIYGSRLLLEYLKALKIHATYHALHY